MMYQKDIKKGFDFLFTQCHKGNYSSFISDTRTMENRLRAPTDIFSSLLILSAALKYRRQSRITKETIEFIGSHLNSHRLNFYKNANTFPYDTETPSFGAMLLLENHFISKRIANKVANAVLSNIDSQGRILMYFEPCNRKNRIDYTSIANILYFINLVGKGEEVSKAEDLIYERLRNRAYLLGSRYYMSPDVFLYFISRLTLKFPRFKQRFGKLLKQEVVRRVGVTDYPLDLAMRTTICNDNLLEDKIDRNKLLSLQTRNGSWPYDAIYCGGSHLHECKRGSKTITAKKLYIGSNSITTAFSLESLLSISNKGIHFNKFFY